MRRGELAVGLLVSAGSVALVSASVDLLRHYMPVLSLGVLYVFAVLAVAVWWGIELALVVSVASMLAFNWFFLPPTHTFQLRDGANWAVLAVYLVTAVVVSALATRARHRAAVAERREREAAVLAVMARDLLAGFELSEELERVSALTAEVLGVPYARIEVGAVEPGEAEDLYPLVAGHRHVATLLLDSAHAVDHDAVARFLPALASLLAVELDRGALQAEAVEAEALRRSDAIKTAVLRAVSHDLRSPLTAIMASAGALANSDLQLDDGDRENLVAAIREETGRLDRVIGNLLDLSRLQAGITDAHFELWSVDELVGQAIEAVGRDGQRIVVELDAEAPPVRVDAGQVERVLANLLENALKFSPAGAPVVVRVEHGTAELRIHVVDRGPGISAADRESLFQPFRSGDAAAGGAGLGLAIARGFAEANGGRLWAQDDGTGGHFVLALATSERPAVHA